MSVFLSDEGLRPGTCILGGEAAKKSQFVGWNIYIIKYIQSCLEEVTE